jgi:hypothetical protein
MPRDNVSVESVTYLHRNGTEITTHAVPGIEIVFTSDARVLICDAAGITAIDPLKVLSVGPLVSTHIS